MIDPDNIDSVEVLACLNDMGYTNVSVLQLKEFMRDLRELISYHQLCPCGSVKVDNSDVDETNDSSADPYSHENESNSGESFHSGSTGSSDICSNCNLSKSHYTSDSTGSICSSSTSNIVDNSTRKLTSTSLQPIQPHSSFIRPWRLQKPVKRRSVAASLKSDPVQLYHKYRQGWELQKVPGEKAHSQLRWTIREKMLGQDPHPRPVSQASSECRSHSMFCK